MNIHPDLWQLSEQSGRVGGMSTKVGVRKLNRTGASVRFVGDLRYETEFEDDDVALVAVPVQTSPDRVRIIAVDLELPDIALNNLIATGLLARRFEEPNRSAGFPVIADRGIAPRRLIERLIPDLAFTCVEERLTVVFPVVLVTVLCTVLGSV
jgi:hypothetical protein